MTQVLSEPIMTFHKVDTGYNRHFMPVTKNLNLSYTNQDWVSITGCNGSGKSTLAHTIARQIEPLNGQILMPDINRIHYIPTNFLNAVLPRVTVYHLLEQFCLIYNVRANRIQQVVYQLKIEHLVDHYVQNLSYGQ